MRASSLRTTAYMLIRCCAPLGRSRRNASPRGGRWLWNHGRSASRRKRPASPPCQHDRDGSSARQPPLARCSRYWAGCQSLPSRSSRGRLNVGVFRDKVSSFFQVVHPVWHRSRRTRHALVGEHVVRPAQSAFPRSGSTFKSTIGRCVRNERPVERSRDPATLSAPDKTPARHQV